jgi:hypothetical protein
MTDEQWKIVNELRMLALGHGGPCCAEAANEIERLAEELEKTRKDRDEWHFKLQHFLVRYAKEARQ